MLSKANSIRGSSRTTQTIFHSGRLLRITRQIRHGPKFANLASQLAAVLGSVPCGYLRGVPTTRTRISVGLGLRDAFKNEVLSLSVSFLRHVRLPSLGPGAST